MSKFAGLSASNTKTSRPASPANRSRPAFYYNATPLAWVYNRDFSRPAGNKNTDWDWGARLTAHRLTVADVASLNVSSPDKLAYVTQTTLSIDDAKAIVAALRARFPSIHIEAIGYLASALAGARLRAMSSTNRARSGAIA